MKLLETLYPYEKYKDYKKGKITNNKILAIGIIAIMVAVNFVFYESMFLTDKLWKTKKCNSKYLFFSGYIKRNPDRTSFQSSTDNFMDCVDQYNKNNISNSIVNNLENQNNSNIEELSDYLQQSIKSRDIALQERKQNRLDDQKKFKLKTNIINKQNNSNMEEIQSSVLLMNKLFVKIKDYLHSYLTYAMMNFAVKYKRQQVAEENTASCDGYSSTDCENQETCIYEKIGDNEDKSCIKKSAFFKDRAQAVNDMMKTYFGGNKL